MSNGNESKKSSGIRVFVYGTLKANHSNHDKLRNSNAEFLGRCYLEGAFCMVSLSAFPGVIRIKDNAPTAPNRIFGEVYRISQECLDSLDILEGNGQYYTRSKVLTPYKNAWCYFLPPSYLEYELPTVDNGVWAPSPEELAYVEQYNGVS